MADGNATASTGDGDASVTYDGRLLSAMREKTDGRDLVRLAATRFATTFLTLQSLYKHKDPLKFLIASDDFTKSKLAKTEAGKKVYDTLLSREFWNSIEDCLRASLSLLIVLRVVDGDEKAAMPEVAALMSHAKEKLKIQFSTDNKASLLNGILEIIERRWDRQMDTPLYGASSSGCERNWSTFEFIHTKKRNRLEHKRLNDLVYISYNRKMAARFQKRKEEGDKAYDPLVIEEFNWENEWVDPNAQPPSGSVHSDLTWDQIDEAIGASRELRGRNLPRACTRRASVVQEVLPLGEFEEDEAEIILDDLDVADDFGEPQVAAIEGEENNTSAANNDLDDLLDDF